MPGCTCSQAVLQRMPVVFVVQKLILKPIYLLFIHQLTLRPMPGYVFTKVYA